MTKLRKIKIDIMLIYLFLTFVMIGSIEQYRVTFNKQVSFIVLFIISGMVSRVFGYRLLNRFTCNNILQFTTIGLLILHFISRFFSEQNRVEVIFLFIIFGIGAGLLDYCAQLKILINYDDKIMYWVHSIWGIGTALGILQLFQFTEFIYKHYTILVGILIVGIIIIRFTFTNFSEEKLEIESLFESVRQPNVIQIVLCFMVCNMIQNTVVYCGEQYLLKMKIVDSMTANLWILQFSVTLFSVRFMIGYFSEVTSRQRQIRISRLIAICGGIFLLFSKGYFVQTGILLIGVGCAPIFPHLPVILVIQFLILIVLFETTNSEQFSAEQCYRIGGENS